MTSQEIAEFVNQPTPRKVPGKVFNAVINKDERNFCMLLCGLALMIILLIIIYGNFLVSDMLLDIGNKMTEQGTITSMLQISSGRSPIRYRLTMRFTTPDGVVETSCYVSHRNAIPGWGIIPETRNNPDLRRRLSLRTPFPVTVEYIPWYPSLARAVGTRSSPDSYFLNFIYITTISIATFLLFIMFRGFRRTKRLLREGLFTTKGRVLEFAEQRNIFKRLMCKHSFFVSFIGQHGERREGVCTVTEDSYSACARWADNGGPVNLLYLPDRNEVIITDLWRKNTMQN